MGSLDRARKLMMDRLAELDHERKAIETALASLDAARASLDGNSAKRPSNSKRRRPAARRVRRGERQLQFLTAVREHPGESIAELATELGVKPQQLYPIARRLSDQGAIAKWNGGFKATADSSAG